MEERLYFIGEKGKQKGPFTLQQLINYQPSPNQLVWFDGLQDWIHASAVPELENYFSGRGSYSRPTYGTQGSSYRPRGYSNPTGGYSPRTYRFDSDRNYNYRPIVPFDPPYSDFDPPRESESNTVGLVGFLLSLFSTVPMAIIFLSRIISAATFTIGSSYGNNSDGIWSIILWLLWLAALICCIVGALKRNNKFAVAGIWICCCWIAVLLITVFFVALAFSMAS